MDQGYFSYWIKHWNYSEKCSPHPHSIKNKRQRLSLWPKSQQLPTPLSTHTVCAPQHLAHISNSPTQHFAVFNKLRGGGGGGKTPSPSTNTDKLSLFPWQACHLAYLSIKLCTTRVPSFWQLSACRYSCTNVLIRGNLPKSCAKQKDILISTTRFPSPVLFSFTPSCKCCKCACPHTHTYQHIHPTQPNPCYSYFIMSP